MDFYRGDFRILYVKVDADFLPVACLTDNTFSETSDFLQTTTRQNNGWKTSLPVNQSFTVDFSGLQILTAFAGGDFTKVSYDKLKEFKRDRILKEWKLATTDNQFVELFSGYISDLSENAVVDDLLSFSGSIVGYGEPISTNDIVLGLSTDGTDDNVLQDANNNIIDA